MAYLLAVSVVYTFAQGKINTGLIRGPITGWAGLIRVDNVTYTWLGAPPGPALVNQTAFEYTSTKSIFTQNVNNQVQLTVTFLSPITPNDYKRQSLIFTYLDVVVESIDGSEHVVELYSDISAGKFPGFNATIQI